MNTDLDKRITAIETRNKRVQQDKAWETSRTRKLSIMALTYLVVVSYLHFVVKISPWINGLVPVIGFALSTMTLTYLKKIWISRNKKRP